MPDSVYDSDKSLLLSRTNFPLSANCVRVCHWGGTFRKPCCTGITTDARQLRFRFLQRVHVYKVNLTHATPYHASFNTANTLKLSARKNLATVSSHSGPVLFCSFLQPSSIRRLATPWTYFLHLSLSSVILIDSSTESPVYVLMLSTQAVRGLPLLRAPGIVPCIISFSRQLPCFLMVWP